MRINLKHYFFFPLFLILILIVANIMTNNISTDTTFLTLNSKLKKNITGVSIEKKNENGDILLITADILNEDKKNNIVKLINTKTKINKKGMKTFITADKAIVKDDYDIYNLYENIEIKNYIKKFLLKTDSLNGSFKKGTMFTQKTVNITIKNAEIRGEGLKLYNYGSYIKIIGKARLVIK